MENKTVLVTGATSGIGLALIDRLLEAGYTPILTARNADKVQALATEKGVAGYALDVADSDAVTRVLEAADFTAIRVKPWGR